MNLLRKTLSFAGEEVVYFVKPRARTRRLRLTFFMEGYFVVTVPLHVSEERLKLFLHEHVSWMERVFIRAQTRPKRIPLAVPEDRERYQKRTEEWIRERLEEITTFYHCRPTRVRLRSQVSRWGSCSRKGVLNLNMKLGLLPPVLAEYVLVHEVCHLREFNHAKAFWKLVQARIPDYRERRRELRRYSLRDTPSRAL